MKYSVNFSPEKCRGNAAEGNVRMIVQWSGGGRVSMFVGHKVVIDKWSKEAQRCKPNTMHGKFMAARINKDIQKYDDAANKVMQGFDEAPSNDEVKQALMAALGKEKLQDTKERNFWADYTQFLIEQSRLRSWSLSTALVFNSLAQALKKYKKDFKYVDAITQEKQDGIIEWLQGKEYKASTIREYIAHLNWYLRWAEKKKYIAEAPNYRPAIKTAPKKVIFLTKDELLRLYNADFDSVYKRRARDFFCLSCFTGLRHSDVYALKKLNIQNGAIRLISKKDTDNLTIELNKYSREILDRAELKDSERKAGYAMPHIDSVLLNRMIKKIAKECGINEPITLVYYRGNQRVQEVKEKWQLISTHTGRKTFICTALSQGISPSIIMKWTGHSDYDAMKPYIDIVDEAKKIAMTSFDEL